MTPVLWLPAPLPNLNELIAAASDSIRTKSGKVIRGAKYAALKRHWGHFVKVHAMHQRFDAITGPAHFEFEFVEQDRRRDPDGFVSGGIKIIFDALQEAGLMRNDGWNDVLSITPRWSVDKKAPGVRVIVRCE